MIFFALLFSACASAPISEPTLDIEFDNGYVDHFSSRNGLFTRDMCRQSPNLSVRVVLSEQELQQIAALSDSTGFFQLPDHLESFGSDEDRKRGVIRVIAPCAEFRLRISSGTKSHVVEWMCAGDGSSNDPESISKLAAYIRREIYTKPAVEELSRSDCHFY
jgi:hypothetical protein